MTTTTILILGSLALLLSIILGVVIARVYYNGKIKKLTSAYYKTKGELSFLYLASAFTDNNREREKKELNSSYEILLGEYMEVCNRFTEISHIESKLSQKYSELEVKYDELERDYNISLDTISQLQKEKKEIALGINNKK